MNTSKASLKTTTEWNTTNWRKLERKVFKLQKRIYQASQRGDRTIVRKLQKVMMSSWSARMLAVRKVTQDNRGKKTGGVDGVRCLLPTQRLQLAKDLDLKKEAKPIRRVWIPKPGKTEKRPLGIPVMHDRAAQALVKLTIEPEWEAKFEKGSYGFRPGRSAHDAIGKIFTSIRQRSKYVLDADIKGCFDNIDHDALLKKIHTFPKLRRVIRSWLKAGIMENHEVEANERGTPQGGVISPLLSNIALDGLEAKLKTYANSHKRKNKRGNKWLGPKARQDLLGYVRYADDFVVMHDDRVVIEQCKRITEQFLKEMGLELKPEKTSIKHTLIQEEKTPPGFNFLGFTVKQFPVGKNHTGKDARGTPLGFKTIITPSKDNLRAHTREVGALINAYKDGGAKAAMITRLNPIIRGWCNYYSTVCSADSFATAKNITYHQIRRWVRKRHLNRSIGKANREYQTINGRNWVLATKEGLRLISHIDTKIKRHVLVLDRKSPYDGDWVYWSQRLANSPHASPRLARALKRQNGKCAKCDAYLITQDVIEIHHKDGNRKHNEWKNLCAIHGHCHDAIHGTEVTVAEDM
jgi:RNA-directed DNA polymerase